MKPPSLPRAAVVLLAAVAASAAYAETTVVVDDFRTGHFQSPQYRKGWTTDNHAFQLGAMLGGRRDEALGICDTTVPGRCGSVNPYGQTASFAITPSALPGGAPLLIHSAGYDLGPRLEVDYGWGDPMSIDFASRVNQGGTGRLRVDFDGLSETLNFNVLLFSSNGHYAQSGCNIPQHNGPFSAELVLDKFHHDDAFTFADVSHIVLIFQSSSTIGTVNFGVRAIEASDTPHGGSVQCFIPLP